MMYEVFNLLQE